MYGQAVLLISLFLFSDCAKSATIDINNPNAVIGESVTIICLLPSSQDYQMFRLIRGETNVFSLVTVRDLCPKPVERPPAMKPSFSVGYTHHSASPNSVAIHLTAKEILSGDYKCAFMNGTMDYVSTAKRLTVGNLAYVSSLTVKPKTVIQGTLFHVECIGSKGLADGSMKIYSKNQIVEAVETQVTTTGGTPLTKLSAQLQAPKESTGETFTCKSMNILNLEKKNLPQKNVLKVTVPIYHPPNTIEILPKKLYHKNGDHLTCNGRGHPAITFKWLVKYDTSKNEIKEFVGKQLKLDSLKANKMEVTCIAENTIANKKYSDRKIITLERNKSGLKNVNFQESVATNSAGKAIPPPPTAPTESAKQSRTHGKETAKEAKSPASSTDSAKQSHTHSKPTGAAKEDQFISTPSLQSRTTQLGFMPMTKSSTKAQNVTEVIKPKRELTKTDRRYENVILYLKLSISFNLIFGIAILFTMIGLCLRVSNFMK